MAYLSKLNYKESRNSDGSIFSKGAECEIMFGPDEVTFDLEKGFERDGIVLLARAFVAKGLQEKGTVTAKIDVELNKEAPKASAPIEQPKTPPAPPAHKPEQPKAAAPTEPIDLMQLEILYKATKRSEKNLKIVDNYLEAVGRMKLEDLSRTQATRLIDRIAKEGN